ncbi:MAG TPA: S9 family peptidase [Micromonosporaceae bacterium]|nr:S9 family peptidase [Micromonosporaceae bacterium]
MQTYRDYRPDRRFQPTVAVSPDGNQVAYSDNLSGQYNLVLSPITGGPDRRLTSYTDASVRDIRWTPDGRWLIFAADANGDEFYQVRRISADGGEIESLTDTEGVQYALADVSPDGRWIAYGGNDREPQDQDVLIQDLSNGEVRRVYSDGGAVFGATWAPDGTRLLAVHLLGNTEMRVMLLDTDGKPADQLLPFDGEEPGFALPSTWLPDGSGFLLRTDRDREFVGVARFDLASRELTWMLTPEWDVEDVQISDDGSTVVWTVNANGVSEMHSADLAGMLAGEPTERPAPQLPAGPVLATSVDRTGTKAAVLIATGARPINVASVDLTDGGVTWLTDTASKNAFTPVEPTLVHFPTHDGRDIPAWVYMPPGDGPFPVVLSIHGGPEAQDRPSYNYGGLYQFLVGQGIAVLAPNIRGSNGYGRTYQRLILRDWGGGDLGDFEAAARWLQAQSWCKPDRIGVFGGSYGGFATLSCLSRLPRYFACGVDIVGPSNLVTLAKSVPPTWRAMMASWVGDPETEAEFLLSRSPITYAHQIVAPLFVIQGANDPRVKQAESDSIVQALRDRGVEVRYDVYADEGHGFTRKENEAKGMGDSGDFLVHHLTG